MIEVLSQRHTHPGTGAPVDVRVTVAMIDGRPEVIGVEMWSVHPATVDKTFTGMTPRAAEKKWGPVDPDKPAAGIRTIDLRLPLATIAEDVAKRARRSASLVASKRSDADHWAAKPRVQSEAERIIAATGAEPAKPRGRRPLPRSHYEEVAKVYSDAIGDPTQAVKEHWHVSKSQAAKWIYRCRREPLNLLPPTSRGRLTTTAAHRPDEEDN